MRIEKLVCQISIWYQIDDQQVRKIQLNIAYLTWGAPSLFLGPPPSLTLFFLSSPKSCFAVRDNPCRSPYMGSVSENHTHVKPMTSKGAIFSPLPPTSGIRETDGLMIGVIQAGSLAGWVVVWLSAWLAD